jgi:hypothetical protein
MNLCGRRRGISKILLIVVLVVIVTIVSGAAATFFVLPPASTPSNSTPTTKTTATNSSSTTTTCSLSNDCYCVVLSPCYQYSENVSIVVDCNGFCVTAFDYICTPLGLSCNNQEYDSPFANTTDSFWSNDTCSINAIPIALKEIIETSGNVTPNVNVLVNVTMNGQDIYAQSTLRNDNVTTAFSQLYNTTSTTVITPDWLCSSTTISSTSSSTSSTTSSTGTFSSSSTTSQTFSHSPYLRSESYNYADSLTSVSCTLNNVVTSDILFAVIQSSGTAQSTLSASDSASDTFTYLTDWTDGFGSAYTVASPSGQDSITLTVGNSGAGLSLFCYDIAEVGTTGSMSSASTGYGTSLSVPTFNVLSNSFVISIFNTGGSAPTFTAGKGFTLATGTPILGHSQNDVGSEWAILSGTATTCPVTSSLYETWAEVCFAFPP